MAIKWDDYIKPLVSYISSYVPLPEGANLKTSLISDQERLRSITSDLPKIAWAAEKIIIRSEQGFLAKVLLNDQKYLLLSTTSRASADEINETAREIGLTSIPYNDAFFLFCVKEMRLQIRNDFNPESLKESLCFDEKRRIHLIDFDKTRAAFNCFYAWQIGASAHAEDSLLRFVLAEKNEKEQELRSSKQNNINVDIHQNFKYLDVAYVAESIIRPITEITGQKFSDIRISITDPDRLLPALKEIKIIQEEIIFRPGGGAFFQFTKGDKKYLGISVPDTLKQSDLADYLEEFSIVEVDYDEAEYLTLAHQLNGSLGVRKQYIEHPQTLLDRTEINEQTIELNASGLTEVFDKIFIFDLSNSSLPGIWDILLKLALKFRSLSSPFISNEIRSLVELLSETDGVVAENAYLSLTASHWKHSFLEAFRLIEGLYYFGWMNKLKLSLGSKISEFELARSCKTDLSWKSKELPSIQNLFALVPEAILDTQALMKISSIQGRLSEAKDHISMMRAFGGVVYSIRNSGVHQGDHESESRIMVTSDCWPRLTEYIFKVILYFYSDPVHKNGMPAAKV